MGPVAPGGPPDLRRASAGRKSARAGPLRGQVEESVRRAHGVDAVQAVRRAEVPPGPVFAPVEEQTVAFRRVLKNFFKNFQTFRNFVQYIYMGGRAFRRPRNNERKEKER